MSSYIRPVLTLCLSVAFLAASAVWAQDEPAAEQPAPEASTSIAGVGPTGPLVQVSTGYAFTEGPMSDGQGNLYFVDFQRNNIHVMNAAGEISVFSDQLNMPNGIMFRGPNEMLVCEMGTGAVVSYNPETKERKVLVDQYEGVRFNAPNDLVLDKAGNFYFTDPTYNGPTPPPQGVRSVYFVSADGSEVKRVVEDLNQPNGILLSLDESTLYVLPTQQSDMMAYPIESPGVLGEGRVWAVTQPSARRGGGRAGAGRGAGRGAGQNPPADGARRGAAAPGAGIAGAGAGRAGAGQQRGARRGGGFGSGGSDGATMDAAGNVYLTAGGIQIFSPAGEFLGRIDVPEIPANVTFGGPDNKTLYITARTSLYSIPMEISGHVFGPMGAAAE